MTTNLPRGSSQAALRSWLPRLRYFAISLPSPSEAAGERLEVVFLVAGREGVQDLLHRLRLARPEARSIAASTDDAITVGHDGSGEVGIAGVSLALEVLDDDHVRFALHPVEAGWRLSEAELAQAERVEAVFDAAGLQRLPRQPDGPGWVTPGRYPELF